ncbi:MAG: RNA chaperone ProQ [Succinivibrionaceae bacterium]
MENVKKYSTVQEIVAFLAERFPNCFFSQGDCKPLKIGLFNEIAEVVASENSDISKTVLRKAFRYYTTRWNYLSCLVVGAKRVDMNGNEVEEVTEEHASFALKELTESKAKYEARLAELKATRLAAKKEKEGFEGKKTFKKPFNKNAGKFNKNSNPKGKSARVFNSKNNKQQVSSVKNEEFVQMNPSEISVGLKVRVSFLGSGVVPATVKEINKEQATVELATGMVVKVGLDHIGK